MTTFGQDLIASLEEAVAHDAWFRAKIETAASSDKGMISHDAVMAETLAILEARRHAATRLED